MSRKGKVEDILEIIRLNETHGDAVAPLIAAFRVALRSYMKTRYDATYIYGNDHAKHVYEKVGFVETDVVDGPDCHEVNMAYYL